VERVPHSTRLPGAPRSAALAYTPGQLPSHDGPAPESHSNLFQHAVVSCPEFDYDFWKSLATSGRERVEYYVYVPNSGDRFRRDGVVRTAPFEKSRQRSCGSSRSRIYFFDTSDVRPHTTTTGTASSIT